MTLGVNLADFFQVELHSKSIVLVLVVRANILLPVLETCTSTPNPYVVSHVNSFYNITIEREPVFKATVR